jgi:hypothetical protein
MLLGRGNHQQELPYGPFANAKFEEHLPFRDLLGELSLNDVAEIRIEPSQPAGVNPEGANA